MCWWAEMLSPSQRGFLRLKSWSLICLWKMSLTLAVYALFQLSPKAVGCKTHHGTQTGFQCSVGSGLASELKACWSQGRKENSWLCFVESRTIFHLPDCL
jgi:hypothetical protein